MHCTITIFYLPGPHPGMFVVYLAFSNLRYYRFSGALCSDQYNPYSVVCMDVYIIYNEHYKLYSRTSIIQLASMEPRCLDNRDSTEYTYFPTIGIYLTFVGTKAIKCHAYTTIKVNAP